MDHVSVSLTKVQEYKNSEVVGRIMSDHGISKEEANLIFEQTKLFLYQCSLSEAMCRPTVDIDKGWHCFLLYTRDYYDFCNNVLGKFIHHIPDEKEKKEDRDGNVSDSNNSHHISACGGAVPIFHAPSVSPPVSDSSPSVTSSCSGGGSSCGGGGGCAGAS